MKNLHIFTHTHWDREWFLPAEFISAWLEDLFEKLFQILERVANYQYVLDGQTILLEDYLTLHPERTAEIQHYARTGNLLIGPAYGQVDWRVVSEESLMHNLYYGITDAQGYGNLMPVGWLLDNFGHCSQSPQIHRLFGIEDVFVWRGPVFVDDKISSEFSWESPDGSKVFAHFLMSGYRNFYNLTDTQDFICKDPKFLFIGT